MPHVQCYRADPNLDETIVMSRLFEPGNQPRAGVAARLWRKFVREYGYEPDMLVVINPSPAQRAAGSASWSIQSERAIRSFGGEILIQSPLAASDWSRPFADVYRDHRTGGAWWPGDPG